jgi:hypothetical protein
MDVSGQLHAPAALAPKIVLPVSAVCEVPELVWTLWGRDKYASHAMNRTLAHPNFKRNILRILNRLRVKINQ